VSRVAATVLCIEAVVIALAVPVATTLTDVNDAAAVTAGLGLAVACLVVAGFLRRGKIAYYVGSALQVAAILLGVFVPTMFVLGSIFAVLWFVALYLGGKVDAAEATRRDSGQT
jgi:hypothetical protein